MVDIERNVFTLTQDEGMIEEHEQLESYVTNYYKNLFGNSEESNLPMPNGRVPNK
jgi:hypothetical protein